MSHKIALSHASGIVAEAILEKLPESGIAPDSLVLLDHESNAGKRIAYAWQAPRPCSISCSMIYRTARYC